jgi:hypothetical protein
MRTEDRNRFIEITDSIFEDARENDPEMTIEEGDYNFLINYGKELGKDYISKIGDDPEKIDANVPAYTAFQTRGYLEYNKFIISLYAIGGEELPAIAKLVRDMDEAFCHPNSKEI